MGVLKCFCFCYRLHELYWVRRKSTSNLWKNTTTGHYCYNKSSITKEKTMNILKPVYAHCDIPCGIYETDTMMHSAETCHRMIQKISELQELDSVEKHNTFVRSVMNKEKHAQKVKKELYILWSDYFKPEHLEQFPDLHDTIWKAVKQASVVKQTVSMDEAEKLLAMVHDISHIFEDSRQK